VADVKCGLYEINKHRANTIHGPSTVQKMFQDRTKAMLDCRSRTWTWTCTSTDVDPCS